jgi:hypothetical protein
MIVMFECCHLMFLPVYRIPVFWEEGRQRIRPHVSSAKSFICIDIYIFRLHISLALNSSFFPLPAILGNCRFSQDKKTSRALEVEIPVDTGSAWKGEIEDGSASSIKLLTLYHTFRQK